MQFRVGTITYTVSIISSLVDSTGNRVSGLCRFGTAQILLNSGLPIDVRRHVLFHELAHAWAESMGRPSDEESRCDWLASFACDMFPQFLAQGGEVALMAMQPRPAPSASHSQRAAAKASRSPARKSLKTGPSSAGLIRGKPTGNQPKSRGNRRKSSGG